MILINIVLGNAIQFDKDKRLRRLIHSALRYYKSCSENIIIFEKKKLRATMQANVSST